MLTKWFRNIMCKIVVHSIHLKVSIWAPFRFQRQIAKNLVRTPVRFRQEVVITPVWPPLKKAQWTSRCPVCTAAAWKVKVWAWHRETYTIRMLENRRKFIRLFKIMKIESAIRFHIRQWKIEWIKLRNLVP